jgi:hypothetical protein
MSEANFLISEPVEKKSEEAKEKPLTSFLFIRQRSGMRAVKRRKRKERRALNKALHANRGARKGMKKFGVSDQIQRGFDIAKRWRGD